MKVSTRVRLSAEMVLGAISGILFVVTLFSRDWIEVLFKIDPDNGQGWVEWLVVGVLLVATLLFSFLATFEWRRAKTAALA